MIGVTGLSGCLPLSSNDVMVLFTIRLRTLHGDEQPPAERQFRGLENFGVGDGVGPIAASREADLHRAYPVPAGDRPDMGRAFQFPVAIGFAR